MIQNRSGEREFDMLIGPNDGRDLCSPLSRAVDVARDIAVSHMDARLASNINRNSGTDWGMTRGTRLVSQALNETGKRRSSASLN